MFKAQKESPVEKAFVTAVEKELKGYAFKGDVPGRRFLDRIVILPKGVTLWCELKRPQGGRYSRQQLEWCERLTRMGHYVVLISDARAVGDAVRIIDRALHGYTDFSDAIDICVERAEYGMLAPGFYILTPDTPVTAIWSLPHE